MAFQVFNGKIIKRLCFFMFLFLMGLCDTTKSIMATTKHKVEKFSTGSHRIPLKSIKSPNADTIDCIHIYHQPAFDHPLLKNHTIQMRPSYYPKGLFHASKISTFKLHSKNYTQATTQLWQLNEKCPEGTIPIIRTTQEDVLRANYIKRKLKSNFGISSPDKFIHEYAAVASPNSTYYGTKATINIWNPRLQEKHKFSLSQFWVLGGSGSELNSIEAGWTVCPSLFGDYKTRFFTYWARDGHQRTGCYNLLCPGFVQVSQKVVVGDVIHPWSIYRSYQYEFTLLVWKDVTQGLWWLRFDHEDIGYWPSSLFTVLANSATTVSWGGEVASRNFSGRHTETHMGRGHFSEEGYSGASYFRRLHVVDGTNTLRPPGQIGFQVGNPNCYNLKYGKDEEWEDHFFYGGPGRNPNCA